MNIEALWVGRMDVQMGWDGMVIIGRRLSKSTLGANKGQLKIPQGVFLSLAVFLHKIMTTHNAGLLCTIPHYTLHLSKSTIPKKWDHFL